MESRSSSPVMRRSRPLGGSFRYHPYTTRKKDMKEEVVRLGVKLSMFVAESMFLLCDDIRTMNQFCFKLWKKVIPRRNPVSVRLLHVMHYVYSKDIKPKNGVYPEDDGNISAQWGLIRTIWKDLADGIIVLHRIDRVLRGKDGSFNVWQLSSAIEQYKQGVVKNLEDKLSDVSEANGFRFARERIESNIFDLWKSFFDEETTRPEVSILSDLFMPIPGKPLRKEIHALPVSSPYLLGKDFAKHELVKEEVVRLGVKLSTSVAESMFLLCDDIRTMHQFCFKLWKKVIPRRNPVLVRLLHVMHYVYSKDIKPKKGVYQDDDGNISAQWGLIRTIWKDLADGIIVLHRIDKVLRGKDGSFNVRQLWSAIEQYKQGLLKNLEDKLRDVSEANGFGFARERIESNIFDLWKSFFVEETRRPEVSILSNLFMPIPGKPLRKEIHALPVSSPYLLGKDFAKHEMVKEEVVRLGVELSLYVAESMFLLCDDIRSMLLFCIRLWGEVQQNMLNASYVVDRLLRVIHYVYTKYIKPKKGIYQNNGNNRSVHSELFNTTRENFVFGFKALYVDVLFLIAGGKCGLELTSPVEDALKKIEEKLRCVKHVSKAKGFAREAMESSIWKMWESLYDKDAKEDTMTLNAIKDQMQLDLFLPIYNEIDLQLGL